MSVHIAPFPHKDYFPDSLVSECRVFRIPASSKQGCTVDAAFDGETHAIIKGPHSHTTAFTRRVKTSDQNRVVRDARIIVWDNRT